MKRFLLPVLTVIFILLPSLTELRPGKAQTPPGKKQTSSGVTQSDEVAKLNESIAQLFKQGKYDEALSLAQRVIEIEQKQNGPASANVALAIHNLAEIYLAKKNLSEAEKLFREALRIYDGLPERESFLASRALERIASLHYEREDYAGATLLLERSLVIREKLYGKEDVRLAETLWGLANSRRADRRYNEARPLYLRALSIEETKLGLSNPATVDAMKAFACIEIESHAGSKNADPIQEDETSPLIRRAYCWLGGLKEDCSAAGAGKSEGVLNGKAISLPFPPFPLQAQMAKAHGRVTIAILIGETGRVIKTKAVCGGHPLLIPASIAAARAARFEPATINGQPIQVTGVITYNFVGSRR